MVTIILCNKLPVIHVLSVTSKSKDECKQVYQVSAMLSLCILQDFKNLPYRKCHFINKTKRNFGNNGDRKLNAAKPE